MRHATVCLFLQSHLGHLIYIFLVFKLNPNSLTDIIVFPHPESFLKYPTRSLSHPCVYMCEKRPREHINQTNEFLCSAYAAALSSLFLALTHMVVVVGGGHLRSNNWENTRWGEEGNMMWVPTTICVMRTLSRERSNSNHMAITGVTSKDI